MTFSMPESYRLCFQEQSFHTPASHWTAVLLPDRLVICNVVASTTIAAVTAQVSADRLTPYQLCNHMLKNGKQRRSRAKPLLHNLTRFASHMWMITSKGLLIFLTMEIGFKPRWIRLKLIFSCILVIPVACRTFCGHSGGICARSKSLIQIHHFASFCLYHLAHSFSWMPVQSVI